VVSRKRRKIIFLEEVINTHAQKFRNQTNMISVIEPAQKMDAVAEKAVSGIKPRYLRIVNLTFDL
jgi:hypothetical protein